MTPHLGKTRSQYLPMAALVCALACGSDGLLSAQGVDTGVIPIRVVNGHLIVLTDLVGLRYTNEASFEISFEYPDALTLHPDQYGWLGLDPNDLGLADPPMIQILIAPGIKLSIPGKDVAVEQSEERVQFQNMMTKLYSSGMGERKLKGTIGIGLLKKYHVTLDIPDKQLVLAPPRPAGDPSASMDVADVVLRPFEYIGDRIQVGLTFGDNRAGRMVIGGTNYDTFIDSRVLKQIGKPAGDVTPMWLTDSSHTDKKLDLSRYVAFRPQPFGLSETPSADSATIITGVNILEHFRIELDWTNQTIAFTQKRPPKYPQQDFEFFRAEASGSSAAILQYLEKYPKERLSPEAAALLVKWRLEKDKASDADVMKAVAWAVNTSLPGRRTETCLNYLTTFAELPDRIDLAIASGVEGLKYSRDSFDARQVYVTHNQLGQLYMKKSAWDYAWKHFLSAAFMAPDDLEIVLNLARVYDKQGQTRRAYARYKRVAAAPGLPPEIETEVKGAMDRLKKLLPKDDPLLREEKPPAGRGRGGGGEKRTSNASEPRERSATWLSASTGAESQRVMRARGAGGTKSPG
jgi:hypothetical protein